MSEENTTQNSDVTASELLAATAPAPAPEPSPAPAPAPEPSPAPAPAPEPSPAPAPATVTGPGQVTATVTDQGDTRPSMKMIDSPGQCLACGTTITSPTTGKVPEMCFCGGKIVPVTDQAPPPAPTVKASTAPVVTASDSRTPLPRRPFVKDAAPED